MFVPIKQNNLIDFYYIKIYSQSKEYKHLLGPLPIIQHILLQVSDYRIISDLDGPVRALDTWGSPQTVKNYESVKPKLCYNIYCMWHALPAILLLCISVWLLPRCIHFQLVVLLSVKSC